MLRQVHLTLELAELELRFELQKFLVALGAQLLESRLVLLVQFRGSGV